MAKKIIRGVTNLPDASQTPKYGDELDIYSDKSGKGYIYIHGQLKEITGGDTKINEGENAYIEVNGSGTDSVTVSLNIEKVSDLIKQTVDETLISDTTVAFTESTTLDNIVSGETISILFGKVKKLISEFRIRTKLLPIAESNSVMVLAPNLQRVVKTYTASETGVHFLNGNFAFTESSSSLTGYRKVFVYKGSTYDKGDFVESALPTPSETRISFSKSVYLLKGEVLYFQMFQTSDESLSCRAGYESSYILPVTDK